MPTSPVAVPAADPGAAGIGLRAVHHEELLAERPRVGWLEAHSENYFADGGAQLDYLSRTRELYPLSLHGVGLSLGSVDALDRDHLRRLKRLVDRIAPGLVSEHVCWGSIGGVHLNDLLPLPYTERSAATPGAPRRRSSRTSSAGRCCSRTCRAISSSRLREMTESEFLAALARESGCGLLLDVNNVYVSARNHGFDARAFIAHSARAACSEIHLAGHSVNRFDGGEILIDTHSTHVCDAVWELYEFAIEHCGAVPTLIEWDTDIPALDVLVAEARGADDRLEQAPCPRCVTCSTPLPAPCAPATRAAIAPLRRCQRPRPRAACRDLREQRSRERARHAGSGFPGAAAPRRARLVSPDRYRLSRAVTRRRAATCITSASVFPSISKRSSPTAPYAYFADVARLEWAYQEVLVAAEPPVFDLAALADVPAERHADLVLELNPASRLVASTWPLLAIWRANQPDDDPTPRSLSTPARVACS